MSYDYRALLAFRGRALRVCDPSKKMHKKGILYHRLVMGKVSSISQSSILDFPCGGVTLMLNFSTLKNSII